MEHNYFLLSVLFLVCLIPIFRAILIRKPIDVFEPVYPFLAFNFLLYIIYPLFLISTSHPIVETDAFFLAILYTLLGTAAFYVGYYAKMGIIISKYIPSLGTNWSRTRLNFVVGILFFISVSLLLVFVYKITGQGILFHLLHSLEMAHQYLKMGNFWVNGAIALSSVAFFLFYGYSKGFKKRVGKVILAVYFLMAVGISLLQGVRGPIIVLLAVPIIFRHYYVDKKIKIKHLMIGIPILFVLLTVLNYFRIYGQDILDHLSLKILPMNIFGTVLTGLIPFNTLVAIIESVPEKMEFQYGLYYFYLFIAWVPRVLWPDKPIVGIEYLITKKIYEQDPLETSAQTPTLIGDLYLNFHIPAIIIGMFVWGIFWKVIYSYLDTNRKNVGVVLVYAILVLSGINTIRGSFTGFTVTTLITLLPMVVAILYINGGKLVVRQTKII